MDDQPQLKFLMFENETNICWLDASIALIAHCRTFKRNVESYSESQINKIISAYNEAMKLYNSCIAEQNLESPKMLEAIQASTLDYLKQFLKFKEGEPDSAFCALLNLIYQDKSDIKECLNISWIWKKDCFSCGKKSNIANCKPIITLSKVNTFHPGCPTSIYTCTCKSEQEMRLIYKELPPCLIFHFEKGAGTGTAFPSSFSIKRREYKLTGIIVLEKSSVIPQVNHFVTVIRNPSSNEWLECNDLNPGFAMFTPVKPEYSISDIYIAVFEAFDDMGRLNTEVAIEQDVENTNVEIIELSEGDNDSASDSETSKSIKHDKTSNFSKGSSSKVNASNELLTNDKEDTVLQNLETYDNEKFEEVKIPCNIKNKKVSSHNFKLPITGSLDKSVKEFFEDKKSENEATVNPEWKISENLIAIKREMFCNSSVISKISANKNLEICSNEKSEELSPKRKLDVESEETIEKSLEAKKSKTKATDYPEHKITDTINADITHEQLPTTKHAIIGDMSDVGENKVDKYDENKSQMQINQISFKKKISKNNENKHASSNEVEKRTKDNEDTSLGETIEERSSDKHLRPDKKKNIPMELSLSTKHGVNEDTSNAKKNGVDKNNKKKLQMQIKQKSFKKCIISKNNEKSNEMGKRTNDNEDASSSERIKERSNNKDLSLNKEKNKAMELSLIAKNDITENTSARKNEVDKYDGKKSQRQTQLKKPLKKYLSLKVNENKHDNSNEMEKRTNDNKDTRSSERIKERSCDKYVKASKEKNISGELSLMTKHEIIRENLDTGKNAVGKNDEEKTQMRMKQKPQKKIISPRNNEDAHASSNDAEKRIEDNGDAMSNKRIKKGSGGKCVIPNKEKKKLIINDDQISSTTADEELAKSTSVHDEKLVKSSLRRSKSPPDSDYSKKEKTQMQMKQKPFKKNICPKNNENAHASSNGTGKRAGDTGDAKLNKRMKKRAGGKCVIPNKEKNKLIINDQTSSTSTVDGEFAKGTSVINEKIVESTLRSKELPDSDCSRKEDKLINENHLKSTFGSKELPDSDCSRKEDKLINENHMKSTLGSKEVPDSDCSKKEDKVKINPEIVRNTFKAFINMICSNKYP